MANSNATARMALVCPKTKYDEAKILKCCPFGEELVHPMSRSASGEEEEDEPAMTEEAKRRAAARANVVRCAPEDTRPGKSWTMRMNGYKFKMQES